MHHSLGELGCSMAETSLNQFYNDKLEPCCRLLPGPGGHCGIDRLSDRDLDHTATFNAPTVAAAADGESPHGKIDTPRPRKASAVQKYRETHSPSKLALKEAE